MKYYYGFFRSNDTSQDPDGWLHKVVIYTKSGTGYEEMLLSDHPFEVEYDKTEDLFKPYKCSMATVRMLNKEMNPDFNATDIKDVHVYLFKLKEGVDVQGVELENPLADIAYFDTEWSGYGTPNVYSQGYNSFYDEFELECQDKLSTARYYHASDIDLSGNNNVSVAEFVAKVADLVGITDVYFTNSVRLPQIDGAEGNGNFAMLSYINKLSLYDNDQQEKDLMEVVEGLLGYFNVTAIQVKDSLYVVNYDAVVGEYGSYSHIDNVRKQKGEAYMSRVHELEPLAESATNGTSVTINSAYSRFSVNASHEYFDVEMVDTSAWYNRRLNDVVDETYSAIDGYCRDTRFGLMGDVIQDYSVASWYNTINHDTYGYTAFQFYTINPDAYEDKTAIRVKCRCYQKDKQTNIANYDRGEEIVGWNGNATLVNPRGFRPDVSVFATPISFFQITEDDWHLQRFSEPTEGILLCHALQGTRTSEDYKILATSPAQLIKTPMVEFTCPNAVVKKDNPMLFKSTFTFYRDYIPVKEYDDPKVQPWGIIPFVPISVKITTEEGATYWMAQDGTWEERTNAILIRATIDAKTDDPAFGKGYRFRMYSPLTKYKLKNYSDGFLITAPDNKTYSGDLTVIVYRPFGATSDFVNTTSTLITNIGFSNIGTTDTPIDADKDTSYVHDTGRHINEEMEVEMKYCTNDNKKLASNYMYFKEEMLKNIEYIHNIPTGDVLRAEENKIKAYVRQNEKGALTINTAVHGDVDMLSKVTYKRFPDKEFVVDGLTVDYAYNVKNFNMVEKL